MVARYGHSRTARRSKLSVVTYAPRLEFNLIQINAGLENSFIMKIEYSSWKDGGMAKSTGFEILPVLCFCLLISACATSSVRGNIQSGFQSGTQILGQVARVYSRDDVLENKRPLVTSELKKDLLEIGTPESEILDGSEVQVNTYCYAWNSSVGCKNISMYMAHASPELKGKIKRGSIVAVKMYVTKENRLVGLVVHDFGEGEDPKLGCESLSLVYKGLSSFSPLGPPIGIWLYCKGIPLLQEGWVKKNVPEAPCGPFVSGPCVFELQKPPSDR